MTTIWVNPNAVGANDGTSDTDAYTSAASVDGSALGDNDVILLRQGETYTNELALDLSVSLPDNLTVRAYGDSAGVYDPTQAKPIIENYVTLSTPGDWNDEGDGKTWTINITGADGDAGCCILGMGALGDEDTTSWRTRGNYYGGNEGQDGGTGWGSTGLWDMEVDSGLNIAIYSGASDPVTTYGNIYYALNRSGHLPVLYGVTTQDLVGCTLQNLVIQNCYQLFKAWWGLDNNFSNLSITGCEARHAWMLASIQTTKHTDKTRTGGYPSLDFSKNIANECGGNTIAIIGNAPGGSIKSNAITKMGRSDSIGALYWAMSGNPGNPLVIEDNLIDDIDKNSNYWAFEGHGIYIESGSHDLIVRGNTVRNISRNAGIHSNTGIEDANIQIYGNLITDCLKGIDATDALPSDGDHTLQIFRNTILNVKTGIYLANVNQSFLLNAVDNIVTCNGESGSIAYKAGSANRMTVTNCMADNYETLKNSNVTYNGTEADPRVENYTGRLMTSSPAIGIGSSLTGTDLYGQTLGDDLGAVDSDSFPIQNQTIKATIETTMTHGAGYAHQQFYTNDPSIVQAEFSPGPTLIDKADFVGTAATAIAGTTMDLGTITWTGGAGWTLSGDGAAIHSGNYDRLVLQTTQTKRYVRFQIKIDGSDEVIKVHEIYARRGADENLDSWRFRLSANGTDSPVNVKLMLKRVGEADITSTNNFDISKEIFTNGIDLVIEDNGEYMRMYAASDPSAYVGNDEALFDGYRTLFAGDDIVWTFATPNTVGGHRLMNVVLEEMQSTGTEVWLTTDEEMESGDTLHLSQTKSLSSLKDSTNNRSLVTMTIPVTNNL